jgi:hypothetical protein
MTRRVLAILIGLLVLLTGLISYRLIEKTASSANQEKFIKDVETNLVAGKSKDDVIAYLNTIDTKKAGQKSPPKITERANEIDASFYYSYNGGETAYIFTIKFDGKKRLLSAKKKTSHLGL